MSESDNKLPAEALKPNAGTSGGSLFNIVLMVAIGLSIIAAAVWYKWIYHQSDVNPLRGQNVIVIDTGKIIAAATKKVMTMPNASPAQEGSKLSLALSSAIDEYRKAGALILNTYSVIYVPPEMDKTEEIATKVGVKLE
jgi:hypothetical protein